MHSKSFFVIIFAHIVCLPDTSHVSAGFLCADEEVGYAAQPEGGHTAYSRTGAGGAHSPLQAAAVWQPAGHHRCPQRSFVCVRCEPQPRAPTPSEAAAP